MKEVTSKRLAILAACGLVVLLVAVMVAPAMGASAYFWAQIRDGGTAVGQSAGNLNALTATSNDTVLGVASNNPDVTEPIVPTASVVFRSDNATSAVPTWTETSISQVYVSGLFALNNTNIWASGGNAGAPNVFAPDNVTAIYCWNGTGWDRQNVGALQYQLNGAAALSPTQAWVCGNAGDDVGKILWSNGGAYNSGVAGTAWIDDFTDPTGGSPIKGLSAAGNSVWAVGYEASSNDGKIFKRVGHNNWTLQKTVTGNRLYAVKALNDNQAWACGRGGTVLYTNDGGTNWIEATNTPVVTDLNTITATDMNNVWAGGGSGVVWVWNGTNWGADTLLGTGDNVKGSVALDATTVYMGSGSSQRNRVYRGSVTGITTVNPSWGAQTETINVNIAGNNTHFVDGTSEARFSGTGITVNSTDVTDATHATANITIAAGATVGPRDVNVVTGTEIPNPLAGGFTVRAMHTINVVSGNKGSISPAGPVMVMDGDSATFTITPTAGYHIRDVVVDGLSMGDVSTYTFKSVKGNHTIGAAFSNKYDTWYLAEGSSAWGLSAAINITNPSDDSVNAKLTYMLSDGTTKEQTVGLPATSKVTVNPSDTIGESDFSTKVECVQGKTIAVDRAMSWSSSGTQFKGSHSSIGVTAPNTNWYLPEGSSKWGFETWLLIQNPSDVEASCDVTYMIEDVGPKAVNHKIAPKSRATFNMVDEIGEADASIQVASNVGVIPERAMYNAGPESGGSFNKREGHDSIGTTRPAKDFFLAEGTTAWGFTTYVLIQNPDTKAANVTLTFMSNEGALEPMKLTMPARSRKTVRVNDTYPNKDLSIKVSGDKPIIAERSMFWAPGQPTGQEAMHDSIGVSSAHKTWILPDGQVGLPDDVETFTLVQNPNDTDVQIKVSYLKAGGGDPVTFTDTVKANSRKTYNLADSLTDGGSASILVETVTSGKKVIAERAMYIDGRWSGNDTIGGWTD